MSEKQQLKHRLSRVFRLLDPEIAFKILVVLCFFGTWWATSRSVDELLDLHLRQLQLTRKIVALDAALSETDSGLISIDQGLIAGETKTVEILSDLTATVDSSAGRQIVADLHDAVEQYRRADSSRRVSMDSTSLRWAELRLSMKAEIDKARTEIKTDVFSSLNLMFAALVLVVIGLTVVSFMRKSG